LINKVAITGHSSGIGLACFDLLDLTCNGAEIKGYSKSNGWNIADSGGDKIIQELIDFDPDILINNAYYPEIQTKILKDLFEEWRTKEKKIINIGSISSYMAGILPPDQYITCKEEQRNFVVRNSFVDGVQTKCQLYNLSFSFVATPLLTKSSHHRETSTMVQLEDAALAVLDCIDDGLEQGYRTVERVIQCHQISLEEMEANWRTGARNMAKHIIRTNNDLKSQ
jgi:hypothetical protein